MCGRTSMCDFFSQLRSLLEIQMLTDLMLYSVSSGVGSLLALGLWSYQERVRPRRPEEVLSSANIPLMTTKDLDGSDLCRKETFHCSDTLL